MPDGLVEEARELLGFKSNADAVEFCLKELIRRRRIEDLKAVMGKVHLRLDLPASRRRP